MAKTPEYTPLAQMTIKKMGGDPKEAIRQGKQVFVCRIYGEAVSLKTKEAKNGDMYSFLIGQFRGETPTGFYESEKLFLPGSLQDNVEAALANGTPVQFGYDVFSTPDDNSVGYRYAAKAIIKTEAADRIVKLSESLAGSPLPINADADKKAKK